MRSEAVNSYSLIAQTSTRCAGLALASGVSFKSCGYGVTEEQLTGLLAADVHRTHARTSQFSRRTAHGVAHGRRNGGAEIEMPVTVRVGTGKLEEGPRWRVQRVRLRGGVMQGRALKHQVQP